MTDYYITQTIKFHQEISDEIFEDICRIINDKINEFGLTLVNPIRHDYNNIIECDISLNDDADAIGSCITEIFDSIIKNKEYHGIISN